MVRSQTVMPAPVLRRPLLLALPRTALAQPVLGASSSFTAPPRRCKSTRPLFGGGLPNHAPSPSHRSTPPDTPSSPPSAGAGGGAADAPSIGAAASAGDGAAKAPSIDTPAGAGGGAAKAPSIDTSEAASPPPPPQVATAGHAGFLQQLQQQQKQQQQPGAMAELAGFLKPARTSYPSPLAVQTADSNPLSFSSFALASPTPQEDSYRLHIFSTKHNTHITFTKPNNDCIVSKSAGDVGFRKAQRGSYDAAHQLAASVFRSIEAKGVRPRSIEVLMRGFGQGREATIKALLGQEGKFLRPVLKRFTDSTRLKFGGTRSKKPRRLG